MPHKVMKGTPNTVDLKHVDCCGTCRHAGGWHDNAWCRRLPGQHFDVPVYGLCAWYERDTGVEPASVVAVPEVTVPHGPFIVNPDKEGSE